MIQKHLEFLWQYYRNEPDLNGDGEIVDFTAANGINNSFKIKKSNMPNRRQW